MDEGPVANELDRLQAIVDASIKEPFANYLAIGIETGRPACGQKESESDGTPED